MKSLCIRAILIRVVYCDRSCHDRRNQRKHHPTGENYCQCVRKSDEHVRILHEKLMSREKMKKTTSELRKEVEEKHARAASRHEAFVAQVVKRAGDEIRRINEVRIITSLNEEKKKLMLRQKLHESELRRAEKLRVNLAREEAVLERRKLIEAEKLQRLAEIQWKKEGAQVKREEERKASSAARKARAIEQLRRKEERAKAQQQQAELLAQKLAQKLHESEQRLKIYERANKFP